MMENKKMIKKRISKETDKTKHAISFLFKLKESCRDDFNKSGIFRAEAKRRLEELENRIDDLIFELKHSNLKHLSTLQKTKFEQLLEDAMNEAERF